MGYRILLARPGLLRLYASSVAARLPLGFGTLAVVLVVREASGSFSLAGAAAGAQLFAAALCAAPMGRLVDRVGQTRVLVPVAAFDAAAFTALGAAALAGAPDGALVALAGLTGVMPPVAACHRSLLASLLAGRDLQTGYSVESVVQEAIYTIGPLMVAAAVALGGPGDALFAAAVLTFAGSLWFAGSPLSRAWRAPRVERTRRGALGAPVVRLLAVYGVLAGAGFGAYEVAIVAFAREEGSPAAAGLLLALWAVGSMAGGLWYGSRAWRHPAGARFPVVSAIVAVALLPGALAPSLWVLAPLMIVAGLAVAPMASLLYTLTGELAPEGTVTEAFTWLNTAFPVGIGAGAALCGIVVDGPGARAGIVLAFAGPAAGATIAGLWRGTLAPRHAGRSGDSRDSTQAAVR